MQGRWMVACVLALACAGGPPPGAGSGTEETSGEMRLFAEIDNRNAFAAEVFAYRNGRWTRIGIVPSGGSRTLSFMWDRPQVQFVIELVGNEAITALEPENDARKTFAADVFGQVPCHLTSAQPTEPGLTLTLMVPAELARNAGGSRCQRRRG